MEFATRTIHAGAAVGAWHRLARRPDLSDVDLRAGEPGVNQGFDYSRTNNPTRARLEAVLADLEGVQPRGGVRLGPRRGERGAAGVAEAGRRDHHPARRLRRHLPAADQGLPAARLHRPPDRRGGRRGLRSALSPRTKLVWIESPTNPRLLVYDIAAIAAAAHARGRAAGRRQHLRLAALPAALPARRRHRRPQRDEVPGRPLRSHPGRGARAGGRACSSRSSSCRTRPARCRRRSTAG